MSLLPALVVGHYSHDILLLANGERKTVLGGSVSYITSVADGIGMETKVVSKVGEDFAYRSQIRHTPQMIPSRKTTQFIADFTQGDRIGTVGAVCELIYPNDIPVNQRFEVGL